MKKSWGRKKFSVFYLVLFVNIFSIVVLSMFNYVVFHNSSKKAYQESFMEYNQKVTDLAFRNIDHEIVRVMYNIPQLYFSETKQNSAMLKPQEEILEGHMTEISNLINNMKLIQVTYPALKSMDLYYENTNTAVTGFTNVHFMKKQQEIEQYIPWYQNYKQQEKDIYFLGKSSDIYPLHEPVFTYIRRVTQPKWEGKGIVVAIHMDASVFSDYVDESIGKLVLLAPDGRQVYASDGFEEGTEQGKTLFTYDSNATSLSYRYYVENSVLYEDVTSTNRIALFNFALSILFNVVLLMIISTYSGKIYLKRLTGLSKAAGIEIEKSNKNFDRSVDQLKEEIQILSTAANSSRTLRFQSEIRALLLNRKPEEAFQNLKSCFSYGFFRILVVQRLENDVFLLEQLQEQLGIWGNKNKCSFLITTMEKGEIIMVVNTAKAVDVRIFEKLPEVLRPYLGRCRIVVGKCEAVRKERFASAYASVCEAARYWFIFREKELLMEEELQMEKKREKGSHLKLFEAMEKDINHENLLEFKLHLEMLVVSFKSGCYTMNYCNATLRDLVTMLCQLIQHKEVDMWVTYGYDIREYYRQIPDIESFEEWISGVCEIFLKNMHQKRTEIDTDGSLKNKLTVLVEKNLENNISLDMLCEELSMRPDTLSRVFKQVMGEGYTEYVKEKKLERAIAFMEEDYSINEIAEKLGYSTSQYFIRIFKSVYGVTPNQYKKDLLARKTENKEK